MKSLGVSQVSVLRPSFYILFTNDIPYNIVAEKTIIFIDDPSFFVKAENVSELVILCRTLLENFETWCYANRLILNIEKPELIKFALRLSPQLRFRNSCFGGISYILRPGC